MPAIEVSHLTKEYRLGAAQGLKQTLLNTGARLTGRPVQERPLFKALDDVSFTIEQGEVVGIIGHNGAGKSTLLKTLARVTTPSGGTVKVNGRIAPLIEVGAGFVPDFTGRENVYLNGAILGMSRKEIDRKFDEIVDFAEMAEFIDTPVKRYSSGMQVKLAFAVATSIDSEILIVDEVLAVGDLAFQRKCFDRMEEIIKRRGNTVLVVSHNIRQIERLSSRVLMLERGKISADGLPKHVCEQFYSVSNNRIAAQVKAQHKSGRNVASSGEIELRSITLLDSRNHPSENFKCGAPMTIRCEFDSKIAVPCAEIMYGIHTTDMVYIATMGTAHLESDASISTGRNAVECKVDHIPLVPGTYALRIGIFDKNRRQIFYGETLKVFVISSAAVSVTKMSALGLIHIDACWRFNKQPQLPQPGSRPEVPEHSPTVS